VKSDRDSNDVSLSRRLFLTRSGLVLGGVAVPWSLTSIPATPTTALKTLPMAEPASLFVSLHLDKPYFSAECTSISCEGRSLWGGASALMALDEREWRMQQPYL
jgi:hypothetical protein